MTKIKFDRGNGVEVLEVEDSTALMKLLYSKEDLDVGHRVILTDIVEARKTGQELFSWTENIGGEDQVILFEEEK